MKSTNEVHHYRLHKYSWTGYAVGGALLLIGLLNMFALEKALYHPMSAYITMVPGVALILRAHRPPIGMFRGVSLACGGMIAGALPLMVQSTDERVLWTGVIAALIGAALIGIGFSPVTKTINE